MSKYIVTLLGYTDPKHTNWYPWKKFYEVFKELNYKAEWTELRNLNSTPQKRRIYICWNEPNTKELVEKEIINEDDILLQKLTSLGKGHNNISWGTDPLAFFKQWDWPIYRMVEDLYDDGINIYAFGAMTNTELFPEKHRICQELKERIFWIPWGSSLYTWREIQKARPIMSGFKYDIGFIGSKWGVVGRGNIDSFSDFIEPLLKGRKCCLAGKGNPLGPVNDYKHKKILRRSKLCPVVNATSWRVERGVQDRFWTVFTTGRFGVVDTEGIYYFFDKDEVVCEADPQEYIEKSLYYLHNIEKQLPFIEKVQRRIKKQYNYYNTWDRILKAIISNETGGRYNK